MVTPPVVEVADISVATSVNEEASSRVKVREFVEILVVVPDPS